MLLWFLPFKGFPSEKSCVQCVDVLMLSTALVICLSWSANFKSIHANAKIQQKAVGSDSRKLVTTIM